MALNNIAVAEANPVVFETLEADAISTVWRKIRATLRDEFGDALYSQEIARLRVRRSQSGAVIVLAPSTFNRDWVEDHAGARIRGLWAEMDSGFTEIQILADGQSETQPVSVSRWGLRTM